MIYPSTDIAGVILAGGKSTRMGTDKALLTFNGRLMIEHIIETMRTVFADVYIVSDLLPTFPGTSPIHDLFKNCGPLGGLHAAFAGVNAPQLFILPCDTPFITEDLLRYMITMHRHDEATVASMDGRIHPLCGIYSRSCAPQIEKRLLDGKNSVMGMLEEVTAQILAISRDLPLYEPHLLMNFNDRQSLRQFTAA